MKLYYVPAACSLNIDLATWPNLSAYSERVAARPAVQAAMRAAGLIRN